MFSPLSLFLFTLKINIFTFDKASLHQFVAHFNSFLIKVFLRCTQFPPY